MSNPSMPNNSEPPSFPQIKQHLEGDRNQAIGQVLGGIVVYVSGGQAVFQSASTATASSTSKATSSEIGSNPYKGLMAFQETDGDRFFGREKQIAALWEKFRSLHETEGAIRVLPIYGPSGSGKSSLARAGLIPELARRPLPGCDRARVAILVPGTHPLEALATVLARIATDDPAPVAKTREFVEELKRKNSVGEYDGLRRIADVIPNIHRSPLIILIDQAEEVNTLCEDQAERSAFVRNLLYASADRSERVSVIVTLRSDFLGETQKYPTLNRLFSDQGFLVPVMSKEELQQAIRQPAKLAGHPLDEATIDLLIEQTHGREGALPLLQFALTRIWEGLLEGIVPATTLEQIGGVGGALAGEAQRIYDSLPPTEQAIARRVFLGLVQLGEGTKDTRRRVPVERLMSYLDKPEQVKLVIERFAEPGVRLITCAVGNQGRETAEVTHEALFDHWQLLRQWLNQSRDDLRFQRRLEDAAQHWHQNNRPDGNLWRPPDLDLLRQYQQRAGDNLTPLQLEFFKASERSKNHQKQLWRLGIGGLVASLLFMIYQLQQAQRQQVEQLALTADALLASQPVIAEINAIAAIGLEQSIFVRFPNNPMSVAAHNSLLETLQVNREQNLLQHKNEIYFVVFSPDGKTIACSGRDKTIWLWDAQTVQPIGKPLVGHENEVWSIAFSPDGKTIASGSVDKTVRLWNAQTGQLIRQPLRGHKDAVYSVAFSPDGKTIASGSVDKTVRLWNAQTGQLIGNPLQGHENAIYSVVFSPDGKMIASSGADRTIRLWDARTRQQIGKPLRGHEDAISSIAFSPDGKTIVSGSEDTTIRLWNLQTEQPLGSPLRGHEDAVYSVAFSPDNKTIVSSGVDKTVRLWDRQTEQAIGRPLVGHGDDVRTVAFSPDGKTIASGSLDKTVRLWNIRADQPIGKPLVGHEDDVKDVVFSPDGKMIASGSRDKTVRLWDAQTGQPVGKTLVGHRATVFAVAFSPDGKTIVSGSRDRTVRLWDVQTGQPIGQPLRGHENVVFAVAFSPDGKTIASGSSDKTVRLWDVQTGQPIGQPLRGHEDEVFAVAFSPDGKTIASGSRDRTVRLWDVQTGQPIGQPLRGHEDEVFAVAFSPDGKTVATSSLDKTARLWDVQTGQPIGQPLRGHEDEVFAVAFSPDGKTIATSSGDKTVRLWPIDWALSWQSLLWSTCKQLRYHPSLTAPQNKVAREAKQTCDRYVWSKERNAP